MKLAAPAILALALVAGPAPRSPAVAQEAPSADSTAILTGRVYSATTGRVVDGARILVPGTRLGAVSDSTGRFRIAGLPSGDRPFEVRRIGFAPATGTIHLAGGATVDATFVLEDTVVQVEGIRVTVRRALSAASDRKLERVGYYRRRTRGLGHFLGPADVERRVAESQAASDVLRNIPGLSVSRMVLGRARIELTRGTGSCQPVLFLDGKKAPELEIDDLNRFDLLAVEVYRGASEIPLEFSSAKSGCGIVLLWTKSTLPG
ncbi:MAG TPA: carboxypeptidase-like regulatory domain-containing protein [Gemmatimonadota bacterium]|nr:carboxypeptidase-like regulatory domain-containing protein [Gemmatimonadota bacterium]